MKKFLKLTKLSKVEMAGAVGGKSVLHTTFETLKRHEINLQQHPPCGCACAYANQGGSSTQDNANANLAQGLHSPGT